MPHYIWPPVVIIVSFAILINFLFKKADGLDEREVYSSRPVKYYAGKWSLFWGGIGNFFLKLLEKLLHRARLLSLKLHNLSGKLQQTVRRKKNGSRLASGGQADPGIEVNKTVELESVQDVALVEQTDEEGQNVTTDEEFPFQRRVQRSVDSGAAQRLERKKVAPLQAQKVSEAEVKEGMENALIRRIAINPRDIEAYERLGDYYLETNNLADSLECYNQVVKLSPIHYKARLKVKKIEKLMRAQ